MKLCGYALNHRIVQVPLKIYITVFSGLGATNVFSINRYLDFEYIKFLHARFFFLNSLLRTEKQISMC